MPSLPPIRAAGLLATAVLAVLAGGCGDAGTADEAAVLVSASWGGEVRALDPETGRELWRWSPEAVGPKGSATAPATRPAGLGAGRDGRWWVALGGDEGTLVEVDGAETRRRVPLPGFRNASRVALSTDGRWVAVSEHDLGSPAEAGRIAVLDDEGEPREVAVCPGPYGLAFDDTGSRLAVGCATSDEVVILDVATLEPVLRSSTTDPGTEAVPGNPVDRPLGVAWIPGSELVALALHDADAILVATATDGRQVARYPVGGSPVGVTATPDGRYLVAAIRAPGALAVVDRDADEVHALPLAAAVAPHDVALSPGGRIAYVAWQGGPETPGGVSAIDLDRGVVLWSGEAGAMATGVAYRSAPSAADAGG